MVVVDEVSSVEEVCMHALISMIRLIVDDICNATSDVWGGEQQLLLA